ncbi:MAG: DUF4401 domain-containing protein [Nitrospinae bacterium]|nr:DUF4401 domain-containing protein [Nitrospinota bacterium]
MNDRSKELWLTLMQSHLTDGEAPTTEELEAPWYIKTLQAFSGWFASLFLFSFFGIFFDSIFENGIFATITGVLMIVGAFFILNKPQSDFMEHIALALSLAGQGMVIVGLFVLHTFTYEIVFFEIALMEIVLAVVMPNFIHRVFSSFFAVIFLIVVPNTLEMPYTLTYTLMFFTVWLWLHEFSYPERIRTVHGIGYGLTLAIISAKCTSLFNWTSLLGKFPQNSFDFQLQEILGEAFSGVILLYVVFVLLQQNNIKMKEKTSILALGGTILLSLASMEAPGIAFGVTIILLGFAGSNITLQGLGVISLLFYISVYYYTLESTLLDKSMTLLLIGVVLLGARWIIIKLTTEENEVENA